MSKLRLEWMRAPNGVNAVTVGGALVMVRELHFAMPRQWVICIGREERRVEGEMVDAQVAAEDLLREMLTAALAETGCAK